MAVFLTLNAPGLRTSPVKRGHWLVQSVHRRDRSRLRRPTFPPARSTNPSRNCRYRQMLAKHRSVPFCAACHARFDSFGLAFEGYGPVGEKRAVGLAGRPVDTQVDFPGGITARESKASKTSFATTGKRISSIISAASCSPTRWEGRSCCPMNRQSSACTLPSPPTAIALRHWLRQS